jgi:hypothetical protein
MAETLKKNVTTSKEDYLKAIWTLSERRAEQKSEASTKPNGSNIIFPTNSSKKSTSF